MGINLYKAVGDSGGGIGEQISSGTPSSFLPKIENVDMQIGITTFRKLYLKNVESYDIQAIIGIDEGGEFQLTATFDSTGDAQVVGDLTGSELKFGSSKIIKAIDSGSNEETVNGAGGLTDIKKIVVEKHGSYSLYRLNKIVNFMDLSGKMTLVADLGSSFEITLETAVPYQGVIGESASTYMTKTIPANSHLSIWIEQYIQAVSSTSEHYNNTKFLLDY